LAKKDIIFQHDNASSHTASKVKNWFYDSKIQVMMWPPQSPDLNPIEHLWDYLKKKLREYPQANNLDELWERVQDVWNNISPEYCLKLIRSMPDRLAALRRSKGGYTRF
jgi:transposase